MNGDAIIQRLATKIGLLVAESEVLRQENIELNQLLQDKKTEVKSDGISSDNA